MRTGWYIRTDPEASGDLIRVTLGHSVVHYVPLVTCPDVPTSCEATRCSAHLRNVVTGGSTPDTFGATRRIPSVPYGPISDDGFGAVRRIPSTPARQYSPSPKSASQRLSPPRVHVMPLRIFSCPRYGTENGVKSTFPNVRGHGFSRIIVKTSGTVKIQDFIGITEVLTWKCSI